MKHWKVLNCDTNLKRLDSSPPRFCFARGRNLKDHLVSSNFTSSSSKTNWLHLEGNYRCGRCVHCSNTYATKTDTHTHTGQNNRINEFASCMATHVIYKLVFPSGKIYVGQTKRNLKLHIAEHQTAIRNGNMDYNIARHFKERVHGSAASLKFIGLEKISLSIYLYCQNPSGSLPSTVQNLTD